MLPDRRDDEWDRSLSGAILEAACSGRHQSRRGIIDRTLVSPDILHSFVNCVRVGGRPGMSPGARIILAKYYQRQRNSDNRDAARTTLRLLESLIRISQAHAKLMLHPNVRMMDAVWAVILVECSLSGAKTLLGSSSSTNLFLEKSGIHNSRIDLYASSAQEPAAQYAEYERIILLALNINPMILEFRNKDNNEETIVNIENLDSEAEDLLTQFTWEPTQRPFD